MINSRGMLMVVLHLHNALSNEGFISDKETPELLKRIRAIFDQWFFVGAPPKKD